MAKNSRPTQEKKRRERARQEQKAEKDRDRQVRKEHKKVRDANLAPGEDPDLVGIYHGPQPIVED